MAFYRRLGELLLAAGTITQEDLDRGLALQKEQRRTRVFHGVKEHIGL